MARPKRKLTKATVRRHELERALDKAWFAVARTQARYYEQHQRSLKLAGQLDRARIRLARLQGRKRPASVVPTVGPMHRAPLGIQGDA